ncbi:TonB-dependent receptor [Flavobacterium chungbukense]|uniref:Carboxypeptidase-like regulatory domain-containing protein n=1 Tax=Flavobacterium chungbukense TaxID=877464 RepID=A0ABP7XUW6_9FLAO|nr:TonB-dependent receptor [Flavobacterium chungbukense]MCC4921633.1 TonB-dependent receptor [Flavobacterium chungbukense]
MRKFLLILFAFISNQLLFAQNTDEKLSIELKNADMMTVIQTIEKSSSYRFYFDSEWIKSNKNLYTASYNQASIEEILGKIFTNTNLNFYILKKKVILTSNSSIHDKLPANYFPETNDPANQISRRAQNPVFYQQYDSLNSVSTKKNNSIVFIGKESDISDKKTSNLSGYIRNAATNKPEANVNIKIRNKNISTVTDNEGHYSIQMPLGVNVIEIKSLNYKKKVQTVMVYNDGTLDLDIHEDTNLLDEVVIKKRGKRVTETVVSGLVSIDIEAVKNVPLILGERDLFKIATTFPGIKTTGEGSAGFNVRGGKEDQNLILLNNAVLYNPQHFLGFFSAINPYVTKKADIYKGSIPVDFGGRLSSVFDISSKNGNAEKVSGEGSIGPITTNITVGLPIEKNKSSILAGVRATYSDWILKSLDDEDLKNSEAGFYDVFLKYNNTINKNNAVEATAYYSKDRFRISSDSLYKYSNRLISAKWDHTYNKKNKSSLIFSNSEYKFNIDYDSNDENAFDFGYKINETQLMMKFNYAYNEKHSINYGLSSKLYNVSPGYQNPKNPESLLTPINIDKEKGLESAIFIADNFKLNDKLEIDLGLRYSFYAALGEATEHIYQDDAPLNEGTLIDTKHYGNNQVMKTYGGIEPRVSARYFFTKDFSVKASFDQTRQYIHLLSNNTTQSPTDSWTLSNTNVKPQSGKQYSLGLYKTILDDEIELSLEGYYKRSKNIMDYKVGANLLLNEAIETQLLQGDGKAYGVEFLLKKQYGRLNGWIGYTYSRTFIKLDSKFDSERINNGDFFPANFDKPHDLSTVLNYKFTKRYSLSTNFMYQTGRPITYPIGTYQYGNAEYTLYSDRNKYRIPDYIRLDIGINIEGNHKIKKLAHSFWNISVYNVLGRNNPYSIYFATENGQVKAYKTSIFSIPVPSITYNFKF